MPEQEIEKIAEKANMIIAGFSYSMTEDRKRCRMPKYFPFKAAGYYRRNLK